MSGAGDAPAPADAARMPADGAPMRADAAPDPADAGGRAGLLVLSASPYAGGRCDRAARHALGAASEAGWEAGLAAVRDYRVLPCRGCNACGRAGAGCVVRGDRLPELVGLIDGACALLLVSPVFFAGPPAQLKAVFDRLQPLWAARRDGRLPVLDPQRRRPLWLLAAGSGGDPFGVGPLAQSAHSALRMLGFELRGVTRATGEGSDPADAGLLAACARESVAALRASLAAFPPWGAAPVGTARALVEGAPRA